MVLTRADLLKRDTTHLKVPWPGGLATPCAPVLGIIALDSKDGKQDAGIVEHVTKPIGRCKITYETEGHTVSRLSSRPLHA